MNPFQSRETSPQASPDPPANARRWRGPLRAALGTLILASLAGAGHAGWVLWNNQDQLARGQTVARHQLQAITRLAWDQAQNLAAMKEANQRERSQNRQLSTELDRLRQEHHSATENHQRLEEEMRSALESRDITISELAGELTLNILDRVLFASGEADITLQGQGILTQVAEVLAQYPDRPLQVVGHTDNVPISTARFPSNWELSCARAVAAVRFLTEQAGVPPQRISAVGYGEFHPVADNGTPEGRARNRRIAIIVLPEIFATLPEPEPAPRPAPSTAPVEETEPTPAPAPGDEDPGPGVPQP